MWHIIFPLLWPHPQMSIILYYYVTLKTAIVDHCWAFETQRRVQSCSFVTSCFSPACSFPRADHHTWHGVMWLKLCTHGGAGTELHQCQYWRAGCKDNWKIRAGTEAQHKINSLGFRLVSFEQRGVMAAPVQWTSMPKRTTENSGMSHTHRWI